MSDGDAHPHAEALLVTVLGASGFVGSAVTRQLARRRVRLRLVARRPAPVPENPSAEIEVRAVDLTKPGALADAVAGSNVVLHLVAHIAGSSTWRVSQGDSDAERVNVGLMRDLVEILRNHDGPPTTVIYAGAASQVGLADTVRIDGSEPDEPRGIYDRQKLAAERVLEDATAEGAVRGVTLRLPTVFGCGPDSTAIDKGVVATMVRRALGGQPITMWHDGSVRRDLVHVDDVAHAFVAAFDHQERLAGGHWLIGSGRGEPLGDVFALVAEIVSDRTSRPPVTVTSVPPPDHAEAGDFHSIEIDGSAFCRITGWRPKLSLREALTRTVTALDGVSAEAASRT